MSIYNRRNAAVGYLTLKAVGRAIDKKRRPRRSGLRVAAYVGLGLVSAGILAGVLAIALRRRHGDALEDSSVEIEKRERDRRRVRHRAGAPSGHVSDAAGRDDASLIRPALAGLVPYEPGKPVEEVQRELGLERVVKLASNEGPYGPFPAAQEAIARAALELNRYPDGGSGDQERPRRASRRALRGGDGLCRRRRGRRVPLPVRHRPGRRSGHWLASFPSYVLDSLEAGRRSRSRPTRDERIDLDALLAAITPRTKLVFIAAPNNPTGTTNDRAESDAYFEHVPPHVLTVLDQAYFEYLDELDYPDGVEE